jgi:hypothetical protein
MCFEKIHKKAMFARQVPKCPAEKGLLQNAAVP